MATYEEHKKAGTRPKVGEKGGPKRPIEGHYGEGDTKPGEGRSVQIKPQSPEGVMSGDATRKRLEEAEKRSKVPPPVSRRKRSKYGLA